MVVALQIYNGIAMQSGLLSDEEDYSGTSTAGYTLPKQEGATYSGFPVLVNPLNLALQPLYLTQEEAKELDDLLENPRAFPTLPIEGLPRGDRSRLSRRNR
jgi:hypothetical protein